MGVERGFIFPKIALALGLLSIGLAFSIVITLQPARRLSEDRPLGGLEDHAEARWMPAHDSANSSWSDWTASAATTTAASASTLPPLERFAENKPFIWGNRVFYILLGLVYLVLVGVFVKRVIEI